MMDFLHVLQAVFQRTWTVRIIQASSFIWLNRFEMLHHTAWPKSSEKQDKSFVSEQTHRGELWLLVALTPHLHTLFWRSASPMPQSFKGLKSNFSPCNPGAFQTSHAVYWHMTKKFNPFSSLCLQDCNSPQCLVVVPPERPEQTEPQRGRGPCLSPLTKFVIRCDAVVHFFKFVIKANVFWQQLVTSAPEERQQISFFTPHINYWSCYPLSLPASATPTSRHLVIMKYINLKNK